MPPTKKKPRPRKKAKKPAGFFSIKKVVLFFFLTMLVVVSVFAAGYVIFFRTVFAGEIPTNPQSGIVFEEPDPPDHEEPVSDLPDEGTLPEKKLPKVAIIIDDLGYHELIGDKLLNFPITLSYSFLPFAPHTGKQELFAFNSGKTVLLHLPLEPKLPHWDPGPGALLLSDSPELQKEKFEQALDAVPIDSKADPDLSCCGCVERVIADVEHELGKALSIDKAEVAVAFPDRDSLLFPGSEGKDAPADLTLVSQSPGRLYRFDVTGKGSQSGS